MKSECQRFIRLAHAGLVLRGYNKASEIDDLILREIWMLGAKLAKRAKGKSSRRDK